MILRPLAPTDLDRICDHRERMFHEAGRDQAQLVEMTASFRIWLEPRLEDGRYFGWMAEQDGQSVGGIGLMVIDWPPHPSHPSDDRRGYVLNVYVEPQWRGQGIAKRLMAAADQAFAARGIDYAILHATAAGRPLYEKLGWSQTSEMAKRLEPQSFSRHQ